MNEKRIPKEMRTLVQRPAFKDGKPAGMREIPAKEVYDWAETEDEVVVITTDGHRFRGPKKKTGKTAAGEAGAVAEPDGDPGEET